MTVNKPFLFGITGGSGSGKGYISDIFRKKGVNVIDADKIGHQVCEPKGAAYSELLSHFGGEFFDSCGRLCRPKLAAKVFAEPEELGILNEITHKHIKEEILRQVANDKIAAIDGAVIIGSTVESLCRFLVGVTAPEELRIRRIIHRDKIDEKAARARICAQPSAQFYREHCRYLIENDGKSEDFLTKKVEQILSDIAGEL